MVYDTFENLASVDGSTTRTYTCPVSGRIAPKVFVQKDGVCYRPRLALIEPQEVVTRAAHFDGNCFLPDLCGEAGLVTTNYIGPMNVSFQGIAVSEIPCYDPIPPTGYFTNFVSGLTHGKNQKAGFGHWIKPGNYWTVDLARSRAPCPNWTEGTLYWKIPIGWHRKRGRGWQDVVEPDYEYMRNANSRPLLVGGRNDLYLQKRTILPDGTFVTEKFGHTSTRSLRCRVKIDNRTVQWGHPR